MTKLDAGSLPYQYFMWLYQRVCLVGDVTSPVSYTLVCDKMHDMEFQPLVEHDENRAGDAANLRNRFLVEVGGVTLEPDEVLKPPVSIFEVLVALAERANFMVAIGEPEWFLKFLENLRLDRFNDHYCMTRSCERINKILDRLNSRRYDASGEGGLFPLRRPNCDQREVELWYQMAAYMTENHMY